MDTQNLVLKHTFDKAMLDQIGTLRSLRLTMAESMLRDLPGTSEALLHRGLAQNVNHEELKKELMERIATLRSRLKEPAVLYADELDLYADLIEAHLDPAEDDSFDEEE